MQRWLAEAATAEEQAAIAFDWWRMAVAHIPDPAQRAAALRAVATDLVHRAASLDRRAAQAIRHSLNGNRA
jgi:hypothetical protein